MSEAPGLRLVANAKLSTGLFVKLESYNNLEIENGRETTKIHVVRRRQQEML